MTVILYLSKELHKYTEITSIEDLKTPIKQIILWREEEKIAHLVNFIKLEIT